MVSAMPRLKDKDIGFSSDAAKAVARMLGDVRSLGGQCAAGAPRVGTAARTNFVAGRDQKLQRGQSDGSLNTRGHRRCVCRVYWAILTVLDGEVRDDPGDLECGLQSGHGDPGGPEQGVQSMLTLFSVGPQVTRPMAVEVEVNGTPVVFQIDTGAAVSIMGERTARDLRGLHLVEATFSLYMYTGDAIGPLAVTDVSVVYQGQSALLSLFVVRGEGPALLGRDWLASLTLDWMASASGLERLEPGQLVQRLEEGVAVSEFVPPAAPVPSSGPVPPFGPGPPSRPQGEVPAAGAAAMRHGFPFIVSCDYDIRFRSNGEHASCDGLSCLRGMEGPPSSGSTNRVGESALDRVQDGLVESAHEAVNARVVHSTVSEGNWSNPVAFKKFVERDCRWSSFQHADGGRPAVRFDVVTVKKLGHCMVHKLLVVMCLLLAARVIQLGFVKANTGGPRGCIMCLIGINRHDDQYIRCDGRDDDDRDGRFDVRYSWAFVKNKEVCQTSGVWGSSRFVGCSCVEIMNWKRAVRGMQTMFLLPDDVSMMLRWAMSLDLVRGLGGEVPGLVRCSASGAVGRNPLILPRSATLAPGGLQTQGVYLIRSCLREVCQLVDRGRLMVPGEVRFGVSPRPCRMALSMSHLGALLLRSDTVLPNLLLYIFNTARVFCGLQPSLGSSCSSVLEHLSTAFRNSTRTDV